MQIGATTYAAKEIASQFYSYRSEERKAHVEVSIPIQSDRFELSASIMGAADALPGQDPEKFQVTGTFGFCPKCGRSHAFSDVEESNPNQVPQIDGTAIPDVNDLLGTSDTKEGNETAHEDSTPSGSRESTDVKEAKPGDRVELSEEEKNEVEELKRRDQEVRTHEHAHVAAGGQHVRGGISYEYQVGPDGRRYAVGGEVSIDTSPERTPEETIRKAQTVKKAALAPAQPSSQDRQAAAAAGQMEVKARQEMTKVEDDETDKEGSVAEADTADAAASVKPEPEENSVPELPGVSLGPQSSETAKDLLRAGLTEVEGLLLDEKGDPRAPGSGAALVGTTELAVRGSQPALEQTDRKEQGSLPDSIWSEKGISPRAAGSDWGLPDPPAASYSPPTAKLDYGIKSRAGHLVDIYG
jgi:hypothetical protein